MHSREEKLEAFGRFLDVLDTLREKCPWDRKQTNESLRPNTIEETFELCDALMKDDKKNICKELGDVLFAAVKVARFAGIDPEQAAHAACEKFIRRFAAMEAAAADSGVPLEQRTLAQMQPLWQQAKQTASADNEGKKSARQ